MNNSLKKNIIVLLNDRSLTGNKINKLNKDILFKKDTHCLICRQELNSLCIVQPYGKFCKSCWFAANNNPLGDDHYYSMQFFWNY